ncbi:MAG: methylated-DNA--[protein]-cysteine S-methyltransferase [Pseudomonadota bacterium]
MTARDPQSMVRFSLFPTQLGDCGIAWRQDTVVATSLPDTSSVETSRRLATRTDAVKGEPPPAIQRAIVSMTELLEGERPDLSYISCEFSGLDAFAIDVYAATRDIPPGETQTYGSIALQIGNKQLAQSVGQALGRNPFPIIVPCHRVVGAKDKLTGFSANGGIETKLRMLAIEGAQIGETPGLFADLPLAVKPKR